MRMCKCGEPVAGRQHGTCRECKTTENADYAPLRSTKYKESIARASRAYRDRLANITSETVSAAEALARQGGICVICGEHLDPADLHMDHVIPVARPDMDFVLRLMAATHAKCNESKGKKPLLSVLIERKKAGLPIWDYWAFVVQLDLQPAIKNDGS